MTAEVDDELQLFVLIGLLREQGCGPECKREEKSKNESKKG
jgi:hypothetical protein